MECERFQKLLKAWYLQVQDEALAPARMVEFMENHITECPICMMDPDVKSDITKIITLVLPKDKLKNASRSTRKSNKDNPDAEVPSTDKENSNGEVDKDVDSDYDSDDLDDSSEDEEKELSDEDDI